MVQSIATRYRDFLYNQGLEVPAQANIQDINPARDDVPIPVVYGLRRITPPLIFAAQSSINTEEYVFVYALSEGPCLGIYRLFLNNEYINTDINMVLINDGSPDGNANTVAKPLDGTFQGVAQFEFMSGREAALGFESVLLKSHVPSATRPTYDNELCYLVCVYKDYKDNSGPFEDVPFLTVDLFGKQTAPAGNPDSTIKIWTDNPADHICDYLTNSVYGAGVSTARVENYYFAKAKTYFSSTISNFLPNGQLIIGKKYTSNTVIDTSKTVQENISSLLSQYFCLLPYVNGKFRLIPERDGSSVVDIDENSIIDSITFTYPDSGSKYNRINVVYQDPQKEFTNVKLVYPETQTERDVLLAEDGGFLNKLDLNLNSVTDPFQVLRIAKTYLDRSRKQIKFEFITFKDFFKYTVGDIIRIKTNTPNTGYLTARVTRMYVTNENLIKVEAYTHSNLFYPPFTDYTPSLPDYSAPLIDAPGGFITPPNPTEPISVIPPNVGSITDPGSDITQLVDDPGGLTIGDNLTTNISNERKGIVVIGDAVISTANAKFNNASLRIGVDSGLEIDTTGVTGGDTIFDLGSDDFTVEVWFDALTGGDSEQNLIGSWSSETDSRGWSLFVSAGLRFRYYDTGNNYNEISGIGTINSGWNHAAIVGDSTNFSLYLNGVRIAQTAREQVRNIVVPLRMGINNEAGDNYIGYLDEIRISSSVRYTGTSFTPPSTVFTHDSDTVLLIHCSEQTGIDLTANPTAGEAGHPGTAEEFPNTTVTEPTADDPFPEIPVPPTTPSIPSYPITVSGLTTLGSDERYYIGFVRNVLGSYSASPQFQGSTQDARLTYKLISTQGTRSLYAYQLTFAICDRTNQNNTNKMGFVYQLPGGTRYGWSVTKDSGGYDNYYWDPEIPSTTVEKEELINGVWGTEQIPFDTLRNQSLVPELAPIKNSNTVSSFLPEFPETGINFFARNDVNNSTVNFGGLTSWPITSTVNTNLTNWYPSGITVNVKFYNLNTRKFIDTATFKIDHAEMTPFFLEESRSAWINKNGTTPPF